MIELTRKQTTRQDFVDNHIHHLLGSLFEDVQPHNQQGELHWNDKDIALIRKYIYSKLFDPLGVNEQEFYPFLKD